MPAAAILVAIAMRCSRPVAVAASLFFGRERLGLAWFEETLERMGIARTPTPGC